MINRVFKQELCLRCGICAANCPTGLIQMNDFPETPDGSEFFCNQCGHCHAICPAGAIGPINSENKEISRDNESVNGTDITFDQMAFYMKFRRSIRNYKDKPVEKKTLKEIFEIVRYAPSAGNFQPLQWTVITDSEKINEIAGATVEWMREISKTDSPLNNMIPFDSMVEAWDNGMDPILRKAPCLVVVHAPAENMMATGDGMIALTHLDLALPTFGMGGCWAGLLNIACSQHPLLKEMMIIPEENSIIYPFMLGYPKYEYHRIPERKEPNISWK